MNEERTRTRIQSYLPNNAFIVSYEAVDNEEKRQGAPANKIKVVYHHGSDYYTTVLKGKWQLSNDEKLSIL